MAARESVTIGVCFHGVVEKFRLPVSEWMEGDCHALLSSMRTAFGIQGCTELQLRYLSNGEPDAIVDLSAPIPIGEEENGLFLLEEVTPMRFNNNICQIASNEKAPDIHAPVFVRTFTVLTKTFIEITVVASGTSTSNRPLRKLVVKVLPGLAKAVSFVNAYPVYEERATLSEESTSFGVTADASLSAGVSTAAMVPTASAGGNVGGGVSYGHSRSSVRLSNDFETFFSCTVQRSLDMHPVMTPRWALCLSEQGKAGVEKVLKNAVGKTTMTVTKRFTSVWQVEWENVEEKEKPLPFYVLVQAIGPQESVFHENKDGKGLAKLQFKVACTLAPPRPHSKLAAKPHPVAGGEDAAAAAAAEGAADGVVAAAAAAAGANAPAADADADADPDDNARDKASTKKGKKGKKEKNGKKEDKEVKKEDKEVKKEVKKEVLKDGACGKQDSARGKKDSASKSENKESEEWKDSARGKNHSAGGKGDKKHKRDSIRKERESKDEKEDKKEGASGDEKAEKKHKKEHRRSSGKKEHRQSDRAALINAPEAPKFVDPLVVATEKSEIHFDREVVDRLEGKNNEKVYPHAAVGSDLTLLLNGLGVDSHEGIKAKWSKDKHRSHLIIWRGDGPASDKIPHNKQSITEEAGQAAILGYTIREESVRKWTAEEFLVKFSRHIRSCLEDGDEEDVPDEEEYFTAERKVLFDDYTGTKLIEDGLPEEIANVMPFIDAFTKRIVRTATEEAARAAADGDDGSDRNEEGVKNVKDEPKETGDCKAALAAAADATQSPMAAAADGGDDGDDSNAENVKDEPQEAGDCEIIVDKSTDRCGPVPFRQYRFVDNEEVQKNIEKAADFAGLDCASLAALVRETVGVKAASRLEEEEIDGSVLLELTEEDVRELGLPLGARKKLQRLIREQQIAFESHCEAASLQDDQDGDLKSPTLRRAASP